MFLNIEKINLYQTGVYKILNLINGKYYVGSTNCFFKRYKKHKYDLEKNIHSNQKLQFSYNKHGGNNFVFEIIEICNKEELLYKEQEFIEKGMNIYNISKANRPIGMKGKKHSKESREKIGKIHKGKTGNKAYWFGKKHSKETKEKISNSQLGYKNHYFGVKVKEDVKRRISESTTGIKNHQYISDIFAENIETKEIIVAHTASELSKILGVAESTVGLRLNKKNQRATNSLVKKVWRIYRK